MAHQEAQDQQTLVYRRMAPWQRLDAAVQLYFFAREIVRTREKRKHPHLTSHALEQKVRSFFR